MLKQEVISKMAELADNGTKTDAERYLNSFLAVLEYAAENKLTIKLIDYLLIEPVERKQKIGRNPQKPNETVIIPKKTALKVKVGKKLNKLVGGI